MKVSLPRQFVFRPAVVVLYLFYGAPYSSTVYSANSVLCPESLADLYGSLGNSPFLTILVPEAFSGAGVSKLCHFEGSAWGLCGSFHKSSSVFFPDLTHPTVRCT